MTTQARRAAQPLLLEANYWNPQVFLKNFVRPLDRWCDDATCHVGMRKSGLTKQALHQGFTTSRSSHTNLERRILQVRKLSETCSGPGD